MQITVRVKDVYGKRVVYPVCEKAKLFALIANTTTLTPATIGAIHLLGYTIAFEQVTL